MTEVKDKVISVESAKAIYDSLNQTISEHICKTNPHEVGLSTFGITATTEEINKLDGLTVTTEELNHLSGRLLTFKNN